NLDKDAAKAKIKEIVAEEVKKLDPEILNEIKKDMASLLPEAAAEKSQEKNGKSKSADEGLREMLEIQGDRVLSPWFLYFISYDPRPTLKKVKCPVLALNGEKDLQVPAKENLAAIAAALKEAGNPDVTTKELAGLNHLFQKSSTGLPTEYGKIEETFAPAALDAISDWLRHRR